MKSNINENACLKYKQYTTCTCIYTCWTRETYCSNTCQILTTQRIIIILKALTQIGELKSFICSLFWERTYACASFLINLVFCNKHEIRSWTGVLLDYKMIRTQKYFCTSTLPINAQWHKSNKITRVLGAFCHCHYYHIIKLTQQRSLSMSGKKCVIHSSEKESHLLLIQAWIKYGLFSEAIELSFNHIL